jgi:hypothetical protein
MRRSVLLHYPGAETAPRGGPLPRAVPGCVLELTAAVPAVAKRFVVALAAGAAAGKRLAYTNVHPPPPRTRWTRRVPHPVLIGHAVCLVQVHGEAKTFRLATDRPDAVAFLHDNDALTIPAHSTARVHLRLTAPAKRGGTRWAEERHDALVFVNNETDGINEEVLSVALLVGPG